MNVIFRTDASRAIGTGHAVRCLTLASVLREKGVSVVFISREDNGNCCSQIEEQGFRVVRLPGAATTPAIHGVSRTSATHIASWEEDADDSRAAIEALGVIQDWVIVDHYALDQRWERALRPLTKRIMVIDDLANRPHDCDLLLDQNVVANLEGRYARYVRAGVGFLLGPLYALLRPIYADLRDRTPPREGHVRRLLVSFGGADSENLTERTVAAFLRLDRCDVELDVVVPTRSPSAEAVRRIASGHRNVRLYEGLPTLASLMVKADVAIGAAGTTTWERLCLGLPSLVVSLATNQRPIAAELGQRHLVRWLGHHDEVDELALASALEEICGRELDGDWSRRCRSVVDGKGAARVSSALTLTDTTALRVRHAQMADEGLLLHWANDPLTRRNALSPNAIPADTHHQWLRTQLRNIDGCHLYVVETDEALPVGQVRLQRTGSAWEVHYSLDAAFRRRGLGRRILEAAIASFKRVESCGSIIGRVKIDNHPSRRVFEELGFESIASIDERVAVYRHTFP